MCGFSQKFYQHNEQAFSHARNYYRFKECGIFVVASLFANEQRRATFFLDSLLGLIVKEYRQK